MKLLEYLTIIRKAVEKLEDYGFAEAIDIQEEIRAGKQAVLRIRIVFVDGSALHMKEYIDDKQGIEKLSYAYQYQDENGTLIFRYDNAAHKPALSTKEHKHLSSGEIVETSPPDINDLVDEIIGCL
jgi:hypothetical protein